MPAPSLDDLIAAYPHKSPFRDPTNRRRSIWGAAEGLRKEDKVRAAVLRRVDLGSDELNARARDLAMRIDPDLRDPFEPPMPTCAAATDFWRFRTGLVVGATRLIRSELENARFFTLNPRRYTLTPDALLEFEPRAFLNTIRADLDQALKELEQETAGWVIAGVHGEWRPDMSAGLVHVRGITSPNMLKAVDHLRNHRKYGPNKRTPARPDGMRRRVWIDSRPITLPGALTYAIQQYWPSRWVGEVEPGRNVRVLKPHRMPDQALAMWLLWIDSQRFCDLVMLYGCRVRGGVIQAS